MNPDSRDGAALLVMVAVVVAGALVKTAVGGVAVPTVGTPALGAVAVAVGSALAVVAVLALRRWGTGRALSRRVRVQMVPTDGFDPDVEAVLRFAAGLGRSRRAVRGLLEGPASAVRVRLVNDPDGRLRYEVELPEHARGVLATAGYEEVQLLDVPREHQEPGSVGAVARVELVLARPSTEPLRSIGLDPDPLSGVARAIETVRPSAGESATVCVDLLPIGAAGRQRAHRRMLREARRRQSTEARGPSRTMLEVFDGPQRRTRAAGDFAGAVERRSGQRALAAKLGSPEPLLRIQVLVQASAPTRGRAIDVAQRLASTFDVYAGENYFRTRGLRVPGGLGFFGADGPLRRGRFDRRMRGGLFRPPRRRLVAASEVAGLLKPPTVKCRAANVVRSGGMVPPPPRNLPTFTGQPSLLPLGRVRGERGDRLVGVPLRDTFFSYMGGRSRYGKTETTLGQFLHLARSGHGCFLLDPHEDAIQRAKAYLTDCGLAERVIEINLADHRQPGWNPLAGHGNSVAQRAERVDAVVDAFAAAMGWGEQNTRALNLVSQSAQALAELADRLPAALAPTIFQIPALLGSDEWQAAALPLLRPATRAFFAERFPRLSSEAITPVTNLIDRLRVAPEVAALLGSPVSTYDVRRAMDDGMIVLACPGSGSTRDRVVAGLLVYDLLHQAKTRADLEPDQRRPFYVFLDEVQTYDPPGSDTLAALLEQSAKFGLRVTLLNQNPERLSRATWNAVSTNRSHLSSTALASKAAALLTREWAGAVAPEVITRLERYTYLASVTLDMQISPPFLVHGASVDELYGPPASSERIAALERVVDRATGRRPVADALGAVDGHDAAILEALKRMTPAKPEPESPDDVLQGLQDAGRGTGGPQ